jgi:rod shape determining protein RodA
MKRFDWISIAIVISLIIIGLMMIYASGYQLEETRPFFSTPAGKQSIFAFASLLILLGTQLIDWKFWSGVAYPFYAFTLFLLVLVLIVGSTVKGSTSWFQVGGFSFQPSELAKVGTIMALASFLSHNRTRVSETRDLLLATAIIMVPMGLVLAQGDAGSALVFMAIFLVLFREGMAIWIPGLLFLLGLLFVLALKFDIWVILPLLMLATGTFLLMSLKNKTAYTIAISSALLLCTLFGFLGQLTWVIGFAAAFLVYAMVESFVSRQFRQAILLPVGAALLFGFAYGSSFSGKGYLEGAMTKLNYVPEQNTDFIYSIVGEEHGFIGSVAVILLFLILMLRFIQIGERSRIPFIRHYAYGLTGVMFTHFFVNIGMTMGLMPVIGIPLPFISAGGSSLIGFSLLVGILLSMDSSWQRSRRVV